MTADYDPTIIASWIAGGSVAVVSIAAFAREWMKSRALTDINRDAAINGVEINNGVLLNLKTELGRLTERVGKLENEVDNLTRTIAAIRLTALDCYQLASDCMCDTKSRDALLDKLREIIKDV